MTEILGGEICNKNFNFFIPQNSNLEFQNDIRAIGLNPSAIARSPLGTLLGLSQDREKSREDVASTVIEVFLFSVNDDLHLCSNPF